MHGEKVSQEAARTLVELGVRLLEELRDIYGFKVRQPLSSQVISTADARRLTTETQYRVTTVTPLANDPTINTYELDLGGLNELLDGYAEFLVEVISVGQLMPHQESQVE